MPEKKFEEAMKRLEEIVQSLDSGDLPLEDSLKMFEEGMKLVDFCNKKLEEAERKVSLLIKEDKGQLREQRFEPDEKGEAERGSEGLFKP
jgi:exodeoxyribonuclease VII small subunit